MKWSFMPKERDGGRSYLVVNADESRARHLQGPRDHAPRPAQAVEGCLIACFAMGAHACYIYIRGEYVHEAEILEARRSTRPTRPG